MESSLVYDSFLEGFARAELDWIAGTFRVVLVGGGYEPDPTHSSRASLGDYELGSVPGYDRGGKLLRGRALEEIEPSGLRFAAGEVSWPDFTGRFRYAVVCQDNGTRSTDRLVSVMDFGNQDLTNANIVISYEGEGVCVFAAEVMARG